MRTVALGALSGLLVALAQPGVDAWPLALVALLPLLGAVERSVGSVNGSRDAALGAFACGLVANLGTFPWIAGAVRDFVGTSLVVGAVATLAFAVYQAGLFVLFAVLVRFARSRGAGMVLSATCAMCASEWIYPRVFESYLGLALHGTPLLLQTADLGGPLVLTGLVVAANAGTFVLVDARGRGGRARFEAATVVAAWSVAVAYGGYRIDEVEQRARTAETLRVGIVQTNTGLEADREALNARVRRHVEQSVELMRASPIDLLVWPESSFGWFLPEEATNVRDYVEVGRTVKVPTLFGALTRRTSRGEKRLFNSAVLASADGAVLGIYDKTVLLPVGERIPLADRFPVFASLSPRTIRYEPGRALEPLRLGPHRIGVAICYEDSFPGVVRALVRRGDPELLVNVTNDAWFGDTHEPAQHLAAATLRSVEHHRALVRATHSGVSAVIAPTGDVIARTGSFERASLAVEVPLLAGQTPYAALGDLPGPIAWFVIGVVGLRGRRRT